MPVSTLIRDRENCTVFVANLPQRTAENDLTALFKDVKSIICHDSEACLLCRSVVKFGKSR
jgi:hypothetical protein